MFWKRWFKQNTDEQSVHELYAAAVAQARQPGFYRDFAVPDTLDGRFDMIVLHVFLLVNRLSGKGEAAARQAQALFDLLFADMDQSLREMGVGDLSVGKKIKTMAAAFYGRSAAYRDALKSGDEGALRAALSRNIFPEGGADETQLGALAAYVRRVYEGLETQPIETLMTGKADFGAAPSMSEPSVSEPSVREAVPEEAKETL